MPMNVEMNLETASLTARLLRSASTLVSALAVLWFGAVPAMAQELHPRMTSEYWANVGVFFTSRDFDLSARGELSGTDREFDFDSATGLDDGPTLATAEFGWNFGENWGAAFQYFKSKRSSRRTLNQTIEFDGEFYDVGADIRASTENEIIRIFFAREMLQTGPHRLRLGAGIHWLNIAATRAGEASLDDQSTVFRRSSAKAGFPVPNLGGWYEYSPSKEWLLSARVVGCRQVSITTPAAYGTSPRALTTAPGSISALESVTSCFN